MLLVSDLCVLCLSVGTDLLSLLIVAHICNLYSSGPIRPSVRPEGEGSLPRPAVPAQVQQLRYSPPQRREPQLRPSDQVGSATDRNASLALSPLILYLIQPYSTEKSINCRYRMILWVEDSHGRTAGGRRVLGRTAGGRRVVRGEQQRKEGCQGRTAGGRKVVKWE
jgi:hypothetical protein